MTQLSHIAVKNLTMKYGDHIVQHDISFDIKPQEIFFIIGDSGCGKSTLLRHMIGLNEPAKGDVIYNGCSFWQVSIEKQQRIMRNFGVMYQGGALWNSMTLIENVGLPLREHSNLKNKEITEIAELKLAQVGLASFDDYYPAEISSGMRKRAGIARAMALDPKILFFDEPSAGLDPMSSKELDGLIVQLRDSLDTTIVVVSHELPSIFAIADDTVFLDADTKTVIGTGKPSDLLSKTENKKVIEFLTRGKGKN